MPSPCSGFTSPAASPTRSTRPAAGRVPTMPSFSQPPNDAPPSAAGGRVSTPRGHEVGAERRQQPRRVGARGPVAAHPDPQPDVGAAVGAGEHPPVAGEGAPRRRLPEEDLGERDRLVDVGPQREAPQHPGRRRRARPSPRRCSAHRRRRSRRRRGAPGRRRARSPPTPASSTTGATARLWWGSAPVLTAASCSTASKRTRGTARAWPGYVRPGRQGSRTARRGPTTSMSPTRPRRAR